MKTATRAAFQGDVMFLKVDAVPKTAKPEKGNVVAHSETGHHHIVEGRAVKMYRADASTSYIRLGSEADIIHKRPYDTHETIRLTPGVWEVRRQREWTPEGWRQVQD